MNYKINKNKNIFTQKYNNVKTNVNKIYNYNNDNLKINTEGVSYISQYSENKKVTKIIIYNLFLSQKEIKILNDNKGKNNKIINLNNSLNVEAKLINYTSVTRDNKTFTSIEVEIYKGIFIPQGDYQIIFDNGKVSFKIVLYEEKKYQEDQGYTFYNFSSEINKNLYISFNILLLQENKNINEVLNNGNGNVYLFEKSMLNFENIQNSIREKKYIQEFNIIEINKLYKQEYYLISKAKDYTLIHLNNINKYGIYTKSIINNIQIYQINKNNILYNFESKETFIEKTKIKLYIFIYVVIGIIIGKYYYCSKTKQKITYLKQKYNKLENSYKYIIGTLYPTKFDNY